MRVRVTYLNIGMSALAVIFLGYAALTSSPASISRAAEDTLAAVGLAASVPANPYNTLAQQLSDKQTQLDQQAAQLAVQEKNNMSAATSASDRLGFYSLCISAALFILVAINFYLDIRRREEGPGRKFSIDLR